jgi:hypothetical protein
MIGPTDQSHLQVGGQSVLGISVMSRDGTTSFSPILLDFHALQYNRGNVAREQRNRSAAISRERQPLSEDHERNNGANPADALLPLLQQPLPGPFHQQQITNAAASVFLAQVLVGRQLRSGGGGGSAIGDEGI